MGDNFSAQTHPGALLCIKVLRSDPNYLGTFQDARPGMAAFMDVWVLADAQDVGAYFHNAPNSSTLGRQLASSVGETFYGRLVSERKGSGMAIYLGEPRPSDQATIEAHKAMLAGQNAPTYGAPQPPLQPRYEEAPHQYPPAPPQQPTYGQPAAPMTYQNQQPADQSGYIQHLPPSAPPIQYPNGEPNY